MALLTKIQLRAGLRAGRKVRGLLDGGHTSVLAGRSLDFADLREYAPGDDVADLDWKASARHGQLLVKRYVAERKHTVVLLVDTGREMAALSSWDPSRRAGETKRETVITAAGLLGWAALSHGDWVAMMYRDADGLRAMRPSSREVDLERMLQRIETSCAPDGPDQSVPALLTYAVSAVRRRSILVVLTSDLDIDATVEPLLVRLAAQHDVVLVTVADVDPIMVARTATSVRDVGSQETLPRFLAGSARLSRDLEAAEVERVARNAAVLKRLRIDHLRISDSDQAVAEVLRLLERRRRAR